MRIYIRNDNYNNKQCMYTGVTEHESNFTY